MFFLAVIVIDPFDSGRFPTFMPSGSPDDRAPTINISRGRDPRFDSILLGSSRAVLMDPRRITALTGYRFVEMAALGATPREQMTFLHWFAWHRSSIRAIIVATDQAWCSLDPKLPGEVDFPYGLYSDSTLEYLKTTLSSRTLRFMKERIQYALGSRPVVDQAGYFDSEAKITWPGPDAARPHWSMAATTTPPRVSLPALDVFDASLKELPGQPFIVMWMPPYYVNALPPTGTSAALDLAACKDALRDWTQRRGRATFIDFATDTPEAADPRNFLNSDHISNRYMRLLEPRIAAALNQLKR
ncbi:MAG TPA: hypothetical protein VGG01_20795 [Xanthobacteraceae bacterium]